MRGLRKSGFWFWEFRFKWLEALKLTEKSEYEEKINHSCGWEKSQSFRQSNRAKRRKSYLVKPQQIIRRHPKTFCNRIDIFRRRLSFPLQPKGNAGLRYSNPVRQILLREQNFFHDYFWHPRRKWNRANQNWRRLDSNLACRTNQIRLCLWRLVFGRWFHRGLWRPIFDLIEYYALREMGRQRDSFRWRWSWIYPE